MLLRCNNVGADAPALKTWGNILLDAVRDQRRPAVLTAGAGACGVARAISHQETNFATNIGGGVKVGLMGPVRLRVDYRMFRLTGGALNSPAHHIYQDSI
jgi:hypothetical protein